jgi:hypothetical protein
MATIKQTRAVAALVGNGGNVTQAMLKAKYSPNTANTPQKLTDSKGFKEAAKPLLDQLEEERQAILREMRKKRNKANYGTLAGAFDTVTKNIQLLRGDSTENTTIQIVSKVPRSDGNTI